MELIIQGTIKAFTNSIRESEQMHRRSVPTEKILHYRVELFSVSMNIL